MTPPNPTSPRSLPDLVIFVATRREDVPPACRRFLSVDGAVPGAALCWDHHASGELINLDTLPDALDPSAFDGVGTTLADADAVVSVVAVLLGGKAHVPLPTLAVLESASHWCDHLSPHPAHGAETNRLGRGLLGHLATELARGERADVSERFAALSRDLAVRVRDGTPLPFRDTWSGQLDRAKALDRAGRIARHGPVALVDVRGVDSLDPLATYDLHRCPVAVFVGERSAGGLHYTVGVNPRVPGAPADLGPALRALAAREHTHGAPARSATPGPDAENWGGRRTVFGSPWNYGSRLAPEDVVHIVTAALFP